MYECETRTDVVRTDGRRARAGVAAGFQGSLNYTSRRGQ